jgi:hypothetical protein
MAQSTQVQREGIAQVAGRILVACQNGENTLLKQELEQAWRLATETQYGSTFEMERMEVLSGVLESLRQSHGPQAGAVRLLEHLAAGAPRENYGLLN